MEDKQEDILYTFDKKFHHLTFLYDQLKTENEKLNEEIKEKERALLELENKHRALQGNYNNLKTALVINPNRTDVKETRERLLQLVREVDKCISLLND